MTGVGDGAAVHAAYARKAFAAMRTVVDRVEDDALNERPFGDDTNSIAALVVHSTAVSDYWMGHIALGRPSDRERDSEFGARADRAELHRLLDQATVQFDADIAELAERGGEPHELRAFLDADQGDLSLVIHVLEELYQHLGHMDVTADALTATR